MTDFLFSVALGMIMGSPVAIAILCIPRSERHIQIWADDAAETDRIHAEIRDDDAVFAKLIRMTRKEWEDGLKPATIPRNAILIDETEGKLA